LYCCGHRISLCCSLESRLPQVEVIDERKGLLEQSLFDASGFLAPVELTEAEYRVNVKIPGALIAEPARVAATEQAASAAMVYSDLLSFLRQSAQCRRFFWQSALYQEASRIWKRRRNMCSRAVESLCQRRKEEIGTCVGVGTLRWCSSLNVWPSCESRKSRASSLHHWPRS